MPPQHPDHTEVPNRIGSNSAAPQQVRAANKGKGRLRGRLAH